ncbi:transglutaminase TgpA family protein [Porticoccus sp.]
MIPSWQIRRQALFWLLAAFAAVIALHAGHLPRWVLLAAALAMLWRVQCFRGAWAAPGRLVKWGLLAVCLAGLLLEYGTPIGLEPMVALLVSAYVLKLLEMAHRRDAYLVVLLAFFVAALAALFDQSIAGAGYILGCLLLVLAALIGLHQSDAACGRLRPLHAALALLCQALPLMVLLFLLMPRVGALWSVPIQTHKAKTGVTDSMSPGDFSRLGRSAELAFRVSFDGPVPPQRQLYWRGLVLSEFDGRTWSRTRRTSLDDGALLQWYGQPRKSWDQLIERRGQPLHYAVVIEPTRQPWLYALNTALPDSRGVALSRDFRLVSAEPVTGKQQYQVVSWLDHRTEAGGLSADRRAIELQLPGGFNPRAMEMAQRWRRLASDDRALVERALDFYNREFVYTLQPPLLGRDSVDEFLFDSQRGFCEHFAGSFVFLMRAAGIPARVVAGYQGGERHPDDYLLVRQYDAHAWAEVWLAGEGWVAIDPTAHVAPQRIEGDLQTLLGNEEGFLADSPVSLMRFRHISWVNRLRLELEALNYHWALWVLGYDRKQASLLRDWLGGTSPLRMALALLVGGGGLVLLIGLWKLMPDRPRAINGLDRQFLALCRKLEKLDCARRTGEGPRAFAARISALQPQLAEQVKAISQAYEAMRYGGEEPRPEKLARAVKQL